MMRDMNPNSLLAYYTEIEPKLTKREKEVLDCLRDLGGEGTLYDVAYQMNVPVHTISGRFTGLKAKGKIGFLRDGVSPGGNKCTVWGIVR